MYTQDQLYEFYKEFMKPRIQKNIQEIRAIQEEKGLQLKDALLSRADRLFHKCIRQQQEGKKTAYTLHIFFLAEPFPVDRVL